MGAPRPSLYVLPDCGATGYCPGALLAARSGRMLDTRRCVTVCATPLRSGATAPPPPFWPLPYRLYPPGHQRLSSPRRVGQDVILAAACCGSAWALIQHPGTGTPAAGACCHSAHVTCDADADFPPPSNTKQFDMCRGPTLRSTATMCRGPTCTQHSDHVSRSNMYAAQRPCVEVQHVRGTATMCR
eukprot:gene25779-biopygen24013